MKLIVVERKVLEVPELLEEDVRSAITNLERENLDELIGDIDFRYGVDEQATLSVQVQETNGTLQPVWEWK